MKLLSASTFLFICFFNGACIGKEKIKMTSCEWPPFLSQQSPFTGVYAEIITKAFEKVNFEVSYDFYSCKRALDLADEGLLYEGSIAWAKSPEREQNFHFSSPIDTECTYFFKLNTTEFDWKTDTDLEGWSIGAPIGYISLTKLFEANSKENKFTIIAVNDDLQLLKMLEKRRMELALVSGRVATHLLKDQYFESKTRRISFHPKPYYCVSNHAIFSKRNSNSKYLSQILNTGLNKLKQDGEYQVILRKLQKQ